MKKNYNVIGVMSGTSLDGVDLAYITLIFDGNNWSYNIHRAATVPYSEKWVRRLKKAVDLKPNELVILNEDYTELLSVIIRKFIRDNNIDDIDAVCSHGHTILHQPAKGITLQIGNLPGIAQNIDQTVVCNFRVQDVQLGGQGAPLVPIGDRLLFSQYDYCLNLGGFSNVSFEYGNNRLAFDICPVNTVLNHYSNLLGHEYDAGGMIAKEGHVSSDLLERLNEIDFYSKDFPKSLGFEFVKNIILPLLDSFELTASDKLATFTEHIAFQIAKVISSIGGGSLFITGGGAYNSYLIERLNNLLPEVEIVVPDDNTVQFKEALIFALLGVLRLREETNVLASVTGAKHDHSSGFVFIP